MLRVDGLFTEYPNERGEIVRAAQDVTFTVPEGSTLLELATHVHRDFEEKLKSARVWGTGVFDGQSVPRDHVLHDKDVVELHV